MVVAIGLICFFPLFLGNGDALFFKHVGSVLHGASPLYPVLSSGLPLVGVCVSDGWRALQSVLEKRSLSSDGT